MTAWLCSVLVGTFVCGVLTQRDDDALSDSLLCVDVTARRKQIFARYNSASDIQIFPTYPIQTSSCQHFILFYYKTFS